jgi:hypothetical protein
MKNQANRILKEIRAKKRKRLQERKASGKCLAIICHGPGHQSTTFCHNTKKHHKVHEAYFGSDNQYARWKSMKVFSGFFDEPPQEK